MFFSNQPMKPKKPGPLRVLTLGRISTPHQDMKMIDAQHAEVQRTLASLYDGEIDLTKLGEQASGEDVFRETFVDSIELINTGDFDLAILFDLSKASRSPQFMWMFINTCEDNGTRFISLGDGIDTWDSTWVTSAGAAALIHGTHIQHTRHRVAAKAIEAFDHGGQLSKFIFGFKKLTKEEANSGKFGPPGLRLAKLSEYTPIIRTVRERVLTGATYEEIAAKLNDDEVPRGPYAKRPTWTGKMLIAFLKNPQLHGEREIGRYKIKRKSTGEKVRTFNPTPRTKTYPELAHLTPEEHAELLAEMDRRGGAHPRKRKAKDGPKGRARSKTRFPGQIMTCGVCGALFYWCGNRGLKCCNCGDPNQGGCWNHLQVNPDIVCREIMRIMADALDARPEVKKALIVAALVECDRLRGREGRQANQIETQIKSLSAEKTNLAKAIQKGGEMDVLVLNLQEVDKQLKALVRERDQVAAASAGQAIATSFEEVEANFPKVLDYLMRNSYGFADLLRRVIPVFVVVPMQAIDSGRPVARARVTVSFGAMLQGGRSRAYQPSPNDFSITVDLFDPPGHIRCLDAAVKVHVEHPEYSCEQIGNVVGANSWDVYNAMKLHRLMEAKGLSDPYVPITDPATVSRWRMKNGHKPRWDQTT